MNRKLGNNYFVCIELGYGKCIESLKKYFLRSNLYGKPNVLFMYFWKPVWLFEALLSIL